MARVAVRTGLSRWATGAAQIWNLRSSAAHYRTGSQ